MPRRSDRTKPSSHFSTPPAAHLTGTNLEKAEADTIEALTLLLSQRNSNSPPLSSSEKQDKSAFPTPVSMGDRVSPQSLSVKGIKNESSLDLSTSEKIEVHSRRTPTRYDSKQEVSEMMSFILIQL